MKGKYFDNSIIYALATSITGSAIAVFRVSGEGCVDLINKVLDKPIQLSSSAFSTGKGLIYRAIMRDKEKIDDCLISVFKKGHGYTKEESLEISLHASKAVARAVDELFLSLGMRPAQRGEFTFRAMQKGSLTLMESEAVLELIESDSENRRKNAIKRLSGALDDKINSIYKKIMSILSVFEIQLDYSDDEFDEDVSFPRREIDEVKEDILSLLATFNVSKKEEEGIKIVILGDANEGKSTLFNNLIHQNRSIVSSQAGTTRDYICESAELCGEKVFIYDTAGFNSSATGVEKEGIELTHKLEDEADIIIRLLSKSQKESDFSNREKTIFVRNKSDIILHKAEKNVISISASTGKGIDKLLVCVSDYIDKITQNIKGDSAVMVSSSRQREHLQSAYNSLSSLDENQAVEELSIDTQNALCSIRELLGIDENTDEVLDEIFSRFCVGK